MAIISGLMTGFVHPKIPFQIQKYDRSRDYNGIRLESKMIPRAKIQYFLGGGFHTRYATSPGGNHHELSSGNDFLEEPFWLTLIKEAFWALKSLFVFLLEQPSQLKYIEWPSFHSTLKTASLTLFLVALLIVALASVDSALSYLLALLLRKPL
ncbi:hypothetical protein CsSME_00025678 [Camellia sinensis var. sinensis]|uniref:uncharacterized protein LOC114311677 isoform X1 n=1 Tax=Camellia sinensis TaxID=4442 RepID=UPI0010357601|nr:uncharacterized protein LOC114311677 isoform X1 [Camellia sinensis]XP_028113621.1 uncharacterized protein LOC114311677 isoform X1 [Camellia sinensis]